MFLNNHDGTFTEASGALGLDFLEDSRSFALADIDHDGRLEVMLKNRNAPQLRILHNAMKDIGQSISFRLRGHTSNRDAHRRGGYAGSGKSAADKIPPGRVRLSGTAFERTILRSWKSSGNGERHHPLAVRRHAGF